MSERNTRKDRGECKNTMGFIKLYITQFDIVGIIMVSSPCCIFHQAVEYIYKF
jgi:hypothetical protein